MNPDVQRLITESERLTAISGENDGHGRYRALAFDFPEGALHLRCDHDTDEVIAEVRAVGSLAYPTVDSRFLTELVGMYPEYAWTMTNHRGYTDGFQLRFTDAERREHTLQFEGAASTLGIAVVTDHRDIAGRS